jgi:NADH:ubiquinone oxidoreductase subunit 3 (subunit A)
MRLFCRGGEDTPSNRCEVITLVVLMTVDVEHCFISLLAIFMSSLEKCLFKSPVHFKIRVVVVEIIYAWRQWLTLAILASQEAESRRIGV